LHEIVQALRQARGAPQRVGLAARCNGMRSLAPLVGGAFVAVWSARPAGTSPGIPIGQV